MFTYSGGLLHSDAVDADEVMDTLAAMDTDTLEEALQEVISSGVREIAEQVTTALEHDPAALTPADVADLSHQLIDAMRGTGTVEDIDRATIETLLGDAVEQLDRLTDTTHALVEASYFESVKGEGEGEDEDEGLRLTPKGQRALADRLLYAIFRNLRAGNHLEARSLPSAHDRSEDTKRYTYGDPLWIDLTQTIKNALVRGRPSENNGNGRGVRLHADDFEVYVPDREVRKATVLLIDRSLSMEGAPFPAARNAALALHSLIRTRYPRDELHVVGFSSVAWDMGLDLAVLTRRRPDDNSKIYRLEKYHRAGTVLQVGLELSRQLLSHQPGQRQIIVISDAEFFVQPGYEDLTEDLLLELRHCQQARITTNFLAISRKPAARTLADDLARYGRGRAFLTDASQLGEYVIADYVSQL